MQTNFGEANLSFCSPPPPPSLPKALSSRVLMTHGIVGEAGQGSSPAVGRRKCPMHPVTWKHLLQTTKGGLWLGEVRRST